MAYRRKTKDVWEIQGDYGCGWETVCEEDNRTDARKQLRCYEENERKYPHRIKTRRERLEAGK